MKKVLLSVAGFDPSGGAGVLMDIRVFESLGFRGMAVLTALTSQNTLEVRRILPLPSAVIRNQYEALASDVRPAGIKSGMLGSKDGITALRRILSSHPGLPRVVDPVLRSSSGALLLESGSRSAFLRAVRGNASLLTPNLDEASWIAGIPVRNPADMREAARAVFGATGVPCLVTGGHLPKKAIDILYDGRAESSFEHEKLRRDVHGTGCCLSSAALGYLARGKSLESACGLASEFVHEAIRKSAKAGRGRRLITLS
ncbi:MAG: bifunctional hydroxymethylpyrimidine kinase/phosphomethylpyrimidine kinase [Candidatus Aminicenantales bacterium]